MVMALESPKVRQYCIPAKQHRQLLAILKNLQAKSHCAAAILADNGGTPIGYAGGLKKQAVPMLAALAAGNYSATRELSRLIGESGFSSHFHEGNKRSMYFVAIDEDYFLFILYTNDVTFGMIRVLAAQAREELRAIFASLDEEPTLLEANRQTGDKLSGDDFQRELSNQLNSVLRSNRKT